jgi:hypothetical protein
MLGRRFENDQPRGIYTNGLSSSRREIRRQRVGRRSQHVGPKHGSRTMFSCRRTPPGYEDESGIRYGFPGIIIAR